MRLLVVCTFFILGISYLDVAVGSETFSRDEIKLIIKNEGGLKAFFFLMGKNGHQHLDEEAYERKQDFLKALENRDEQAFGIVGDLYMSFDKGMVTNPWVQEWSGDAFMYIQDPSVLFQFWSSARIAPKCAFNVWHYDGERAFDITAPLALRDFNLRKQKVKILNKEFSQLKRACLNQINTFVEKEVSWMKEKGFAFDKNNKIMLQPDPKKGWIQLGEFPPALEVVQIRKELRGSPANNASWGLFDEIAYSGKPWGGDFQRRMAFYEKVASADKAWLLFVKERYADFDGGDYFSYKIPLYIMLGDALTNDAQAVLSIFKEEFSKGDELKNVCGNTYEDLLWGVAVEEQVIGAALDKLEARKKSLTSLQDKSLFAMKKQCLQAVDNSLAIWKGRMQ